MSITTRLLLLIMISIWVAGLLIEFLIPYYEQLTILYPFTKMLYSTVCHQQPAKLILYNNSHTLVCARCSGIYLGGLLSSFILIFIKIKKIKNGKIIILSALPMLIDVVFYSIGLYSYSKIVALITGFLFGSVGIIYIYNGFQILLENK